METDTDRVEEAPSRSPSPYYVLNVLEPEKEFILTYEAIPELWDTTNPHYTNKYRRNENLAKLLPILNKMKPNATLEDVKKKINSLRSNYRREIKKIMASKESGAREDEIYVPKIWYFPYLHFLNKMEEPEGEMGSGPTQQSTPESKTQQLRKNTLKRKFSIKKEEPSVSSTKTKKKTSREELLDCACQYLSKPCAQKNQNDNLPSPLALYWSNTLDRLDPVQRLYAKKAINDILFEAELGNLNRYSVRINDSSFEPCTTYIETHSPYPHSPSPNNSPLKSPPPPSSPSS
ncbi:hypothetical protein ABMA28_015906 [Loxostege sticticalis]|uniref:MADF domain-containing protein n=1 Tax=Loxostege sticticalis TaxID=481309 RepID=A0ABD0TD95_LOXSC